MEKKSENMKFLVFVLLRIFNFNLKRKILQKRVCIHWNCALHLCNSFSTIAKRDSKLFLWHSLLIVRRSYIVLTAYQNWKENV